jgi:hypothetical protein
MKKIAHSKKNYTVFIFLPSCFKNNCKPKNDLEEAETCRSVKCLQFGCIWINVNVFISLLITQQFDTRYNYSVIFHGQQITRLVVHSDSIMG